MHEENLFHDNKKEPFVTKYCEHKNSRVIYHQLTFYQQDFLFPANNFPLIFS